MIVEKLKACDIALVEPQENLPTWSSYGTEAAAEHLAHAGGYTVREGSRILAVGGVVPVKRDVGLAWSILSRHSGPHMMRIHRIARRALEVSGFSRIVANTECDFAAGCRWLETLGFERADFAPGFGADGRDHQFYVRAS